MSWRKCLIWGRLLFNFYNRSSRIGLCFPTPNHESHLSLLQCYALVQISILNIQWFFLLLIYIYAPLILIIMCLVLISLDKNLRERLSLGIWNVLLFMFFPTALMFENKWMWNQWMFLRIITYKKSSYWWSNSLFLNIHASLLIFGKFHHHVTLYLCKTLNKLSSLSLRFVTVPVLSSPDHGRLSGLGCCTLMSGFQTAVLNLQSRESYSQTESDWSSSQVDFLLLPSMDNLYNLPHQKMKQHISGVFLCLLQQI